MVETKEIGKFCVVANSAEEAAEFICKVVANTDILHTDLSEDSEVITQIAAYSDFIFVNRFGATQHQGTLNKAIKRIIRDCNDEILLKNKEKDPVLLPPFSCHSLRHTFTTRAVESGMNVKVLQEVLGHKDISTTLNIYTDVTKDTKKREVSTLGSYFEHLSI